MFNRTVKQQLSSVRRIASPVHIRTMATIRSSTSHEERTARQPRQPLAEPVIVGEIKQINSSIRIIRLQGAVPGQSLKVCTRFQFFADYVNSHI